MQNSNFSDKKSAYYSTVNKFLLPLIPNKPNAIMDVGCGSGQLGHSLLTTGKAREVVGVEIYEQAAKEAMRFYKTVHVGDIEEMNLDYENYFDIVICSDILEHLKEPSKMVNKIFTYLVKGGLIVCSVPNVRYWQIWRDLIFRGKWEYTAEGIMDHTHLRYFTVSSFKKILIEASFKIVNQRLRIEDFPKRHRINQMTFGLFEEFLAIQIFFCGRKE
jgi:2-polyprenyl-3-methyl-5-hydroxy-6-metoxy-1,4-benzoquinol methylase